MGTQKEDFVELSERIGRKTGGLSFSPFTAHKRGQAEPQAYLMVRGKVTASKAPDMLDLMRDILLTARLDDKDRFKQVCLPAKFPSFCRFSTLPPHSSPIGVDDANVNISLVSGCWSSPCTSACMHHVECSFSHQFLILCCEHSLSLSFFVILSLDD